MDKDQMNGRTVSFQPAEDIRKVFYKQFKRRGEKTKLINKALRAYMVYRGLLHEDPDRI